jgi:hypothetical protein
VAIFNKISGGSVRGDTRNGVWKLLIQAVRVWKVHVGKSVEMWVNVIW